MEKDKQERHSPFGAYKTIVFSAITVIAVGIVIFFIIFKAGAIWNTIKYIADILQPIILGLVFSYIINPMVVFFEKKLDKLLLKRVKFIKFGKLKAIIRNFSISLSVIIVLFIIGIMTYLVLPELTRSVKTFVNDFPIYIENGRTEMEKLINGNELASEYIDDITDKVQEAANEYVIPSLKNGLSSAAGLVLNFFVLLKNLIIAIIVIFYVLNSKEHFKVNAKKVIYAFLSEKAADAFLEDMRHIDEICVGYVVGQIIDAFIIGGTTFVFMVVTGMPYPLPIAIVIGLTNIIIFFGPFIGAIPSVFIIMLINPKQAIMFTIFIFVLQQMDGNVIKPNVIGDKTGLSAFWVLFSIVLFGGLMGFVGLVIGVPIFAIFYYLFRRFIHRRLDKKGIDIKKLGSASYDAEDIESIE